MTGTLEVIMLKTLDRLAMLEGLNTDQIAARCVLTGRVPTVPAFSRDVVAAYAKLEQDQVLGTPAWALEDALNGRR
jgi:hypothetical protein